MFDCEISYILFLFNLDIRFCIHFLKFIYVFFYLVVICCLFVMTSEQNDSFQFINVRFDGKNYSCWSYVMKNLLKGKKM